MQTFVSIFLNILAILFTPALKHWTKLFLSFNDLIVLQLRARVILHARAVCCILFLGVM